MNPAWSRSLGEKLDKIHFRKERCMQNAIQFTEVCKIHHDRTDPHESIPSLLIHMAQSNGGKIVLGVIAAAILDQALTGGNGTKITFKTLRSL